MNGHRTHVQLADGREFDIPDIWIAGFCQGAALRHEPSDVLDAIDYWVWQAELADQWEAEQAMPEGAAS